MQLPFGIGLMLVALVVPIVGSPIAYLAGRQGRRYGGAVAALFLLVTVVILLYETWIFLLTGPTLEIYSWIPAFDIEFGFFKDGLSFLLADIISIICFLAAVYSAKYMHDEPSQGLYYFLLLLFSAGMIGTVISTNLIQFYLFWEFMLLPSYFLIKYWGLKPIVDQKLIALKYFLFTHAGALCLILGIIWTYTLTGTFTIYEITALSGPLSVQVTIALLMTVGFMVKMGVFPFHTWLPDAHSAAPTPISVLLSAVMVKTGAYGILRLVFRFLPAAMEYIALPIAALGAVSAVYGGSMALAEKDLKRLLAYSTVSQMGYITFALFSITNVGIFGAMFHILTHAMAKALLFMCAGILIHQTGTRLIDELGGLAPKLPATAFAVIIGGLSLAGTPPLAGFISEMFMFTGGFSASLVDVSFQYVTYVILLASIITVSYYLWTIMRIFFGETPAKLAEIQRASPSMVGPVLLLVLATILIGVFPIYISQFINLFLESGALGVL